MSNESDSKPESSATSEEPAIKVTDRRQFDSDGNPRQADADQVEPSHEVPPQTIEDVTPPEAGSSATAEPAIPDETGTQPESEPDASLADLPRDFSSFVESQYLEALIFLGAVPHPQTGETIDDPDFARYKIDLLAMIQEKTAGNLTAEESRMMEDVLYQLRMLFVQKTKADKP